MSDLILYGIFVQHQKAERPIFVTLFGILMLVSDLQPQYLLLVDYQYYTL